MSEKELLIRMIMDYDPKQKASDLRKLDFATLAEIYKKYRGY